MKKTALAVLVPPRYAAPRSARPEGRRGERTGESRRPVRPLPLPSARSRPTSPRSRRRRSARPRPTQLAFLREEEKLARDVYRALFAVNGDRAFANIATAEQRHMDDVKLLLDRYGLADPAAATAPGEFANARLAALYVDLVARGKASLVEALKVGATIEDLDLSDVGKALDASDNRDIDAVIRNLAKGSRNHLRAFSARLTALGATYTAQYLPADEIATIVAAPRERGAYDENGKLLPGTCTGQGPGGRGQGRGRRVGPGRPARAREPGAVRARATGPGRTAPTGEPGATVVAGEKRGRRIFSPVLALPFGRPQVDVDDEGERETGIRADPHVRDRERNLEPDGSRGGLLRRLDLEEARAVRGDDEVSSGQSEPARRAVAVELQPQVRIVPDPDERRRSPARIESFGFSIVIAAATSGRRSSSRPTSVVPDQATVRRAKSASRIPSSLRSFAKTSVTGRWSPSWTCQARFAGSWTSELARIARSFSSAQRWASG